MVQFTQSYLEDMRPLILMISMIGRWQKKSSNWEVRTSEIIHILANQEFLVQNFKSLDTILIVKTSMCLFLNLSEVLAFVWNTEKYLLSRVSNIRSKTTNKRLEITWLLGCFTTNLIKGPKRKRSKIRYRWGMATTHFPYLKFIQRNAIFRLKK